MRNLDACLHEQCDPALADATGIDWHYIASGKPMQNGFIESFNGRLRNELLNETLFSVFLTSLHRACSLESRLQWLTASFQTRLADAFGVCRHLSTTTGSDHLSAAGVHAMVASLEIVHQLSFLENDLNDTWYANQ